MKTENEKGEKRRILVVDDDEKNLKLMTAILESRGYDYETAKDGVEALEMTKSFLPDLVFLDIMMPRMDGFEVLGRLKADEETRSIPVVMVTALADRESKLKGLQTGASDFIAKPIDPAEVMLRAENLLKVKEFADFLKRYNETLEAAVKEKTKELEAAFKELEVSRDKLKEGYVDTIHKLTAVAEFKDEDTAMHIKRIAHYCRLIAKEFGWPEEAQETIFYASPMHDIGKVGIPSEILLKPGKLNTEEFALMKTHTAIGAKILKGSVSVFLKMAETIAVSHHERWNGGGYPRGIKGDEIPLEGRIMNIADQYDALRSKRPYKPSFSHEKAFRIITEGDGRTSPEHFDPDVLRVFKDSQEGFEEIFESFADP